MKNHWVDGENRGGSVLIIVLVFVVLLTLAGFTFTSLMQTEEEAARLMTRRLQSKYLIDSGVDYTRLFLSYDRATIREKGGRWDNVAFQNVPVALDRELPGNIGRFTVISPGLDDDGNPEGFRYGLQDESAKVNLNVLPLLDNYPPGGISRQLLMNLPYMSEDIADAILDWLDEDDEVREYGAESSYYTGLAVPYECRNGPMDSLDELLLIRGITPQLLFGNDTNRNGVIDQDESLGDSLLEADMELGWINYLTLYSKESNLNDEGLVRVNINEPDLEKLYNDLRANFNEQWSIFIVMGRVNGLMTEEQLPEDAVPVNTVPFVDLDFDSLEATTPYNQILDLVGTYTTMPDPSAEGESIVLRSPIPADLFDMAFSLNIANAMQNITTYEGDAIPGRINIMQASRRVLESIPGLQPEMVDRIITVREFELEDPDGADRNRRYETWLVVEGIVDLATMRSILPLVCVGGDVYKAEVVGYFDDGVGTSRAEVLLDTTVPLPRILFWSDKSHLQSGYDIDILGRDLIE